MKSRTLGPRVSMSADAYAGFLKLLLTPDSRVPRMSSDVSAYLDHANKRSPVECVSGLRESPKHAA